MRKFINTLMLLAVIAGNVSLYSSSANAYTTGYWKSTPSYGGGTTHRYYPSTGDILRRYGLPGF